LDTSFNAGGVGLNFIEADSIAVQGGGKILAVGWFSSYDGINVKAVARLNADGSLDTSFNAAGQGVDNLVCTVAVQSNDGKILIGGCFSSYNGTSVGYLARLNADGTLDPSFNSGGLGANNQVYAVVVQPNDGKILIGGAFTSYNGTKRGCVARLLN
jgi:uncharacterized delta-60 repeat protein